jgi:hypothetical protein
VARDGGSVVWSTVLRRCVLALLLVAGPVVLVLVQPQRCYDQVAGDRVVETCEPLPAGSPVVLGYLLLVGALLLPEVADLEIAGVFKLRRQIAEARADAAEAKDAVLRLTAENRAVALATGGDATGGTSTVLVNIGRDVATAAALLDARGEATPEQPFLEELEPVWEDTGEAALVAFRAGMLGLGSMIPVPFGGLGDVRVLGFTIGDAGDHFELTHDPSGVGEGSAARTLDLLNEDWPPQGSIRALGSDVWIFTAPATDAQGRLVGALAVLLPLSQETDVAALLDGDDEPDLVEELAAAVEVAAEAYARLLIDLLGERPGSVAGA